MNREKPERGHALDFCPTLYSGFANKTTFLARGTTWLDPLFFTD